MQARPFLPLMFMPSEPHTPFPAGTAVSQNVVLLLDQLEHVQHHQILATGIDLDSCMYGSRSVSGL
jgi:hypothetical protein